MNEIRPESSKFGLTVICVSGFCFSISWNVAFSIPFFNPRKSISDADAIAMLNIRRKLLNFFFFYILCCKFYEHLFFLTLMILFAASAIS